MGCATGLVRIIVFIFNFACIVVGIALIALGSVVIADIKNIDHDDLNLSQYLVAPGLILGLGVIIFIISFFGCCGALKNNSCMLTTYSVILLALFIAQLALGIYGYVEVKDAKKDIQPELEKSFKKLITIYDTDKGAKEAIDLIQTQLKCCGADSIGNYVSIPWSCCTKVNSSSKTCDSPNSYWTDSCGDKITKTVKDGLEMIGIVAIAICAIEIVGAVFSMCLASHARERRGR